MRSVAQLGEADDPTLPYEPVIELVGVFAFALSGGLDAVKALDLHTGFLPVAIVGVLTGVGGGVLRRGTVFKPQVPV